MGNKVKFWRIIVIFCHLNNERKIVIFILFILWNFKVQKLILFLVRINKFIFVSDLFELFNWFYQERKRAILFSNNFNENFIENNDVVLLFFVFRRESNIFLRRFVEFFRVFKLISNIAHIEFQFSVF